MTAARRCSGVLYLSTCVLMLLVAVHTRQSAALNPNFVTNWRCSSTLPDNYIYFGAGSTGNFGTFCTNALGPTAAAPTLADYASPCLSAYTRDLALDQYDTTEFAAAGGTCYPNRNSACTPTTVAVYICKAPPLTTFEIGIPQCPLLTADNGLWEYPSGLLYPSWARLVCNTGYKLSNPATYFTPSQANRLWNAAFNPNCTVVTCPASHSIANGNLQISAMTYNSMATLLCTGPTALAGSNTSVCQNDGTWSVPNGRCVVQSGTLTCATALTIANGHLLITSTTVSAMATLVCDNGYVLVGSGSSTCQGGGIWSTPSGACQRTCPQYQTVGNGLLSISANTAGSTATTVCNANYVLVGSSGSATCQSSGIWTTLGTCQQRCTTLPTKLNGGFLFRSDSPGSTTTVVCKAGYVVSSGSTTSTCTAGAWTSVTATCQTVSSFSASTIASTCPPPSYNATSSSVETGTSLSTVVVAGVGAGTFVIGILLTLLVTILCQRQRSHHLNTRQFSLGAAATSISSRPQGANGGSSSSGNPLKAATPVGTMTESQAYGMVVMNDSDAAQYEELQGVSRDYEIPADE